ncbi:hypothetical protein AL013_06030 [Mariprofundus ferrooxydans]|nr:hypothetical protein AL013_06030 [Mariprofundus ferrooxydans]
MALALDVYTAILLLVIIVITYTTFALKRKTNVSALVLILYYVIRVMLLGAYFSLFDHHRFSFLEVNDNLLIDAISLFGAVLLIFLPLPSKKGE